MTTLVIIYRVSQEEWTILRESLPYVKIYRYNPKHLYPKLNGYGDNGQRKVWSSGGSTHCACQLTSLSMSSLECGVRCHMQAIHLTLTLNCISFRMITQCTSQLRCEWLVGTELLKCLFCFLTWNIVTCILCMDFVMAMH